MKAELISLNYHVPQCDTSLGNFPVIIGRAADARIRLLDPSISNYHCCIDVVDGQLMVCDLGSVHGTCVNSCLITKSALKHGDELAVGMLSFLVQYNRTEKRNVPPFCDIANKQHPVLASSGMVAT